MQVYYNITITGGLMLLFTFLIQSANAHNIMFHWKNSFDIHICKNVNITIPEVEDAINYWSQGLDFEVAKITKNNECNSTENRVIQIKSDNNLPARLYGETDVNWYAYNYDPNTKYINHATVRLSSNFIKKNNVTLTHELGHALGLGHEQTGIMRPKY